MGILDKVTAGQLRYPHGLLGRFMLWKLNKINHTMINETVKLLKVKAEDSFLDIGFGGGLSFEILQGRYPNITMHGVEVSRSALSNVANRFQNEIESARLTVRYGAAEEIPFDDNQFDHVVSVNTVYFWDDVAGAFAEIKRVLKPKGVFILALRENEALKKFPPTKYGFHFHELDSLTSEMEKAGFSTIVHKKEDKLSFLCIEALSL